MNLRKLRLGILRITQLSLFLGCFYTFLILDGYGLFFAFLSGYVFYDFLETFKSNSTEY